MHKLLVRKGWVLPVQVMETVSNRDHFRAFMNRPGRHPV